jgi:hypothetical protein
MVTEKEKGKPDVAGNRGILSGNTLVRACLFLRAGKDKDYIRTLQMAEAYRIPRTHSPRPEAREGIWGIKTIQGSSH